MPDPARPLPPERPVPSACTFGFFDGVHRGHRTLLDRLRVRAGALGLRPVVLTFDVHPAEVLRPGTAPRVMTTPAERVRLLRDAGIEEVVVLPFTAELARVPAEEFVRRFLVTGLGARLVLVGRDARFGRGGRGDLALLRREGALHGLAVEDVPDVGVGADEPRCSSTRIRHLLARGDVERAAELLGPSARLALRARPPATSGGGTR